MKLFIIILICGIIIGGAFGLWFRTPWSEYEAPDKAFVAEFRQKPIQMGFPKPEELDFVRDDSLKIYSFKGDFGIDEINRFDNIESPDAKEKWYEATISQTGGKLIKGNAEDFTLFLEDENAYFRGRIVYAPGARGVYKIFSIRVTAGELETLETERFLYGLKFGSD